jgi:hypothetical protein
MYHLQVARLKLKNRKYFKIQFKIIHFPCSKTSHYINFNIRTLIRYNNTQTNQSLSFFLFNTSLNVAKKVRNCRRILKCWYISAYNYSAVVGMYIW